LRSLGADIVFPEDRLERNTIQEWNLTTNKNSAQSSPFSHPIFQDFSRTRADNSEALI
jgi:hypothetical protein